MSKHDCTTCKYYIGGYCFRYPEVVNVSQRHSVCGEYQPADTKAESDNGWISIKDRYPDSDTWVLVSAHGAVNCMAWNMRLREWSDWTHPQAPNVLKQYITHWRPIPEPPEEKP